MNLPKIDKQFVKGSYSGLPPMARGIIAIAVVGGLAWVAYKIIKMPKNIKAGAGNRQEDRGWNQEFDQLNSGATSSKPTLTKAELSSIANQIHTAMDGYGTDEEGIVRVMKKIKNNADFAGVMAAYGTREVSSGAYNPSPNYNGTMLGALADELSSYWMDVINKDLKSKKIKYKV